MPIGSQLAIDQLCYSIPEVDEVIADWRALWASPSKGGAHSRIIWSGAWLESGEGEGEEAFFVTASRDAKV